MSNQIYVNESPDKTLVVDVSNVLTVVTKQNILDALGFHPEDIDSKRTSILGWNDTPSDVDYPSEKLVKEYIDNRWNEFATISNPQPGDALIWWEGGEYDNFKNFPMEVFGDGGEF